MIDLVFPEGRAHAAALKNTNATSASRLLGFASAEDSKAILLQMRLLCLKHIDSHALSSLLRALAFGGVPRLPVQDDV